MKDWRAVYFVLLGFPTWALVDGTWAMLSQLANNVPEGYSISSYLMVALTLGNFFPIFIGSTCRKYFSNTHLPVMIFAILFTGLSAGVLLSQFWKSSTQYRGTNISLPLFILFFSAGSCSALSNVTHYSYVSKWPAEHTTWLATGMGLGSMTTGLLALTQGLVPNDTAFTVELYYILLALFYLPAIASLLVLEKLDSSHVNSDNNNINSNTDIVDVDYQKPLTSGIQIQLESDPILPGKQGGLRSDFAFVKEHIDLLCLQLIISSLGYGLIPSIISTFCGKFANKSTALLFSTSIGAVVDPIFRSLTHMYRITSVSGFYLSTAVLVSLGVVMAVLTSLPPTSAVFQSNNTTCIPILLYISFNGLNAFTNTSIFRHFKHVIPHHRVQQSYRLLGVASQTGALLGTTLTFGIIITGII